MRTPSELTAGLLARRLPAMPRILLAASAIGVVLAAAAAAEWGILRGGACAVLLALAVLAPREWRLRAFTAAAFHRVDPVIGADAWENYRSSRWRAGARKAGVAIDFSFRPEGRTAARMRKYVRLDLHPKLSLWPQLEHIAAVTVRVPPRKTLAEVQGPLAERIADLFAVGVEQVEVSVRRGRLRTWVTWVTLRRMSAAEATVPRMYAEVLQRDQ